MDLPSGWEPIDPLHPGQPKPAQPKISAKPRKSKHPPSSSVANPNGSSSMRFPVTGNAEGQAQPVYMPGIAPAVHQQYSATSNIGSISGGYQPYYAAGSYGQPIPTSYPGQMPAGYPGQVPAYFADPLANVALAYGQSLAGQGKDIVNQNLEKWISISTLKFYFAVDSKYVMRKLFVLCCPFFVRDWSLKFSPTQCVSPKDEPNAPDLYIPSMAFITYVLATGILLGIQNRFDPEHLYDQASICFLWSILEIACVLLTFYIAGISSNLRFLHLLAFTGYKYVAMVACVIAAMFFGRNGYYMVLLYSFAAIIWLFLRSLNVYLQPAVTGPDNTGRKRRILALIGIIILQLLTMFIMTRRICLYEATATTKLSS